LVADSADWSQSNVDKEKVGAAHANKPKLV
jgi:hypothetical protein